MTVYFYRKNSRRQVTSSDNDASGGQKTVQEGRLQNQGDSSGVQGERTGPGIKVGIQQGRSASVGESQQCSGTVDVSVDRRQHVANIEFRVTFEHWLDPEIVSNTDVNFFLCSLRDILELKNSSVSLDSNYRRVTLSDIELVKYEEI